MRRSPAPTYITGNTASVSGGGVYLSAWELEVQATDLGTDLTDNAPDDVFVALPG